MRDYEYIQSRQNPKILEAVSLKDAKKRKEKGLYFFEGRKLFYEAAMRKVPISSVFVREDLEADDLIFSKLDKECRIYRVSEAVYEKISEEKSPEGIFCIAKALDKYHKIATIYYKQENFSEAPRTLLAAVSIRDPGNLGSIIRSCAAFGCDGLILSDDCADLYSSKTIRASMGTIFDFPTLTVKDLPGSIREMQKEGLTVYASALQKNAVKLSSLDRNERCCILVGNEGHGLDPSLIDACDRTLFIEMTEHAESLNAAVASAVMLYERMIAQ